MAYVDVTAIVEGALEDQDIFFDYAILGAWLSEWEAEAGADGILVEIYVLWHEHENDGEECICAQYEASTQPTHTFDGRPIV